MATAQFGKLIHHIHRVAARQVASEVTDRQLLEQYTTCRDELAFATIVFRHGPMVLRVCQRVLGHEQDAEDAFQAVFLVLALNASAIKKPGALAEWLHGVAYRTAMKVKRTALRRRNHEARAQPPKSTLACPTWDGVQAVLDEEIQRLPRPYRTAFVLCVLEGKSGPQAADQLGIKPGTVSSRLTRARQHLQKRLMTRGIQLATLLAAASVSENAGQGSVPTTLITTTQRIAASNLAPAQTLPPQVVSLAQGVTRSMRLWSARSMFLGLVSAVLLVGGIGLLAGVADAVPEPRVAATSRSIASSIAEPSDRPESDIVKIDGEVFGPDGKALHGARVLVIGENEAASGEAKERASTDAQGRFAISVGKDLLQRYRLQVLVRAEGFGSSWQLLDKDSRHVQLHLPIDLPVRGKVIDLEGKPVAGAAIRIVEASTSKTGTLDEFLKRWAADPEKLPTGPVFRLLTGNSLRSPETVTGPAARTGVDGSFEIKGIGLDRGLMLGVRGSGIADHYARILTVPGFQSQPAHRNQVSFLGPNPTVVVAPGKSVSGVVRDTVTRKPLAGVKVLAYSPESPLHWWWKPIVTSTDVAGRYRIEGLAKASRHILAFDPGQGAAHVHRYDEIGDTADFKPIVHDAELFLGTVVNGQVTDSRTGQPVRARVVYAPIMTNENFATTPGYDSPRTQLILWMNSLEMITGDDGRYRLTALPGTGILFVQSISGTKNYTTPVVAKDDARPGIFDSESEVFYPLGHGGIFPLATLNAYRTIRPAKAETVLTVNFGLEPGVSRHGRLVDSEGNPVSGAEAFNLNLQSSSRIFVGSNFVVESVNPKQSRRLLFWHPARRLAGTVVVTANQPEPVSVEMKPLAGLKGRVLDKAGNAKVGYIVEFRAATGIEWPRSTKGRKAQPIVTDKDGRFQIPGLPADLPLSISVFAPKSNYAFADCDNLLLQAGTVKDVGDLRGATEQE